MGRRDRVVPLTHGVKNRAPPPAKRRRFADVSVGSLSASLECSATDCALIVHAVRLCRTVRKSRAPAPPFPRLLLSRTGFASTSCDTPRRTRRAAFRRGCFSGFAGTRYAPSPDHPFRWPAYFSGASLMSTVRQEAIKAIACAKHNLNRVDFKKTHVKDLYGVNVF